MAVNFPSNPTNGQTITVSGITYAYDSTQGVWSDSPQGLTQAIDALTDVDTSTVAPTNGQILQWNSTDSEWQPADSSAGVTVYATIDDLPLSGVAEGSMALVDSTDKLYIFSDAGWYSITLVNTTPSISGVNATYTLATDGTATVVTVTATDAEGIPLTYSIVSDTSGNIATVTQGTGANTNQWTITPSTNTADAGSFTLVFRASDGTNIASASSTFELQFAIVNSNYTTALITSVGANNAVNNSFTDSSSNSHTITANGNVTQNTFSPYRHGGYSVLLDSNTAYLRTPTDARYDIGGTGDWSYEAWVYVPTSHTFANYARAFGMGPFYNDSKSFGVFLSDADSSDKMAVYWHDGSIGRKLTSTTAFDKGKWNHIAVCRTGNDIALYYNGTRIAHNSSYTASISTGNTYLFSGGTGNGTEGFNGYIRDVHFVNGSHDYDASSASLTVPTEKISAITNTKYLGSQEPYINDNSTHDVAITTSGTVTTEPFGPYEHDGYSTGSNGGSMYFDGNDSLSLPQTSLDLGSDDFCVEAWAYTTSTSNQCIVGSYRYADGVGAWNLNINYNSKKIRFFIRHSGGSVIDGLFESGTFPTNQWVHVAVTRDGSNLRAFINGTQAGSTNTSIGSNTIDNAQTNYYVGVATDSQIYWQGYISDVRVVKGSSVYTSAFTPPTAPLTAITNTSLLLNGTDAGIIDKSQSVKTVTLDGSAKSSTTQTKYLTSSMSFAAQTDFLKVELPSTLGTGDFTIEWWAYFTNINPGGTNYRAILDMRHSGDTTNLWLQQSGDGSWLYYPNYPTTGFTSSTFSNNTWYHIAIARENGTIRFYVDGSLTGSGSDSFDYDSVFLTLNHYSTSSRRWTGYASDLRVTKGLARYTAADETANIPSAALGG